MMISTSTRPPLSAAATILFFAVTSLAFPSAASAWEKPSLKARTKSRPAPGPHSRSEQGIASVYSDRRTASGERFSPGCLTAAHRTLPFGSLVRVTAARTGRSVVVRINDRGPFIKGRIIDLSPAAAAGIGLTKKMGITRVEIAPVSTDVSGDS